MTSKRAAKQNDSSFSCATFFVVLLRKVLEEGEKYKSDKREGFDSMVKLIEKELKRFFSEADRLVPGSETILNHLLGRATNFPLTAAATAGRLSLPVEKVLAVEAQFISDMSKMKSLATAELRKEWLVAHPCSGCQAKLDEVHRAGCVLEECPFCHGSLSECFCAYRRLKIKWGGKSRSEWSQLKKQHGSSFDSRKHARVLTTEEERRWASIVLQKGCVKYGSEQRFL